MTTVMCTRMMYETSSVIYPFPHASSGPRVLSVFIPLHETEITDGYLCKDK